MGFPLPFALAMTINEKIRDMFDADDLNSISLAQEHSDDKKSRELMERLFWLKGAKCLHCKFNEVYKMGLKKDSDSPTQKGRCRWECGRIQPKQL
jgi:hypothetical protein